MTNGGEARPTLCHLRMSSTKVNPSPRLINPSFCMEITTLHHYCGALSRTDKASLA